MSLRGVIIDLDGTVYHGGTVLEGVPQTIADLRAAGLELFFFSNNPIRDGEEYVTYLTEQGLNVQPNEAGSAGDVTVRYLQKHHNGDTIYFIGSEGLKNQLKRAGLQLTDSRVDSDVALVSWTPEFGYEDMDNALSVIDEQTTFLGTDPDRTFPDENGEVTPGSGAIIDAVAVTVGREPDAILGKPSPWAQEFALDRLGIPPEECLVVGDRLDTDLLLGEQAGMTTALVLTGVTDRSDIDSGPVTPDYVLEDLTAIERVLADEHR